MRSWPAVSLPKLHGDPLPLRLYDTASAGVRPLAPGQTVRMYVCGITPYDATHIGHAATYTAFDLINRNLQEAGHHVEYVQNITDVDDPLLERATATGVDWQDLAHDQIDLFRNDMTELRVLPPTDFVSVIDSIDAIAAKVLRLVELGAAYQVDNDWYFSVESDPRFGQVAHLPLETELELFAERGGDPDRVGKKHPLDSLLWLAARPGEPSWPSELGEGRPGWHIECVAIAVDSIGIEFDIQGGGVDLAFPHHEMSASQGQVLCEAHPFARHYVHAGLVGLDGEKMSKSRGNLVFVSRLLADGVDPMAIRLALLAHHYRSEWEWTDDGLAEAQDRLNRWRAAVAPPTGPAAERAVAAVRAALADDLNAPAALAAIDTWAEDQRLRSGDDSSAPGLISRTSDALLGVAL